MSVLVQQSRLEPRALQRRLLLAGAVALAGLVAFLLAPGDLARKTHLALHGLCAQRPSHSLRLGDELLPMDARMTGIYLGAAATLLWLGAAGRLRAARVPPASVLIALAAFVAAMGVDGVSGLLVDLHLPHPYEPSNLLRLSSGALAGTALAVGLGHIFASSLWANRQPQEAVVERVGDLAPPLAIAAALGGLALTGLPVLYAPFAVGLLVAAIAVFWTLAIVVLSLTCGRGWSYEGYADLAPLVVAALIVAVVTIGALSGLRMLAEQALGLPRLT